MKTIAPYVGAVTTGLALIETLTRFTPKGYVDCHGVLTHIHLSTVGISCQVSVRCCSNGCCKHNNWLINSWRVNKPDSSDCARRHGSDDATVLLSRTAHSCWQRVSRHSGCLFNIQGTPTTAGLVTLISSTNPIIGKIQTMNHFINPLQFDCLDYYSNHCRIYCTIHLQ